MGLTPEQLADRREIDDVLTRYAVALDTQDWDLFSTCFTADASIDYTSSGGTAGGIDEVRGWLAETMPLFSMTQHLVTNRHVDLDGDTATTRSYFYNPMTFADGGTFIEVGGYYNDRFVRTGDGWRIASRVEEQAWRRIGK